MRLRFCWAMATIFPRVMLSTASAQKSHVHSPCNGRSDSRSRRRREWTWLFWALAVLSMTLGNIVAIAQQNLKRMLAYSSIAHVGYMLVGIVAGGGLGGGSALFYLL